MSFRQITHICALLVLSAAPAAAADDEPASPSLKIPTVVYFAAAGADAGSQMYSSHWGGREANPTIAWLEPKVGTAGMLTIGEAVDATAVLAIQKWLGARHPRALKWALYGGAGVRFYIAAGNISKAREYRSYVRAGGVVVNGRAAR